MVPKPPAPAVEEGAPPDKPRARPSPSPFRLDWAAALERVYAAAMAGRFATSPSPPCGSSTDVLKCARCGGRLAVLAFIEKLTAVRAILDHLGLPSAPLPLGKARGPPQAAWAF